jgi:thiamine-phosphate pyrophosphorylase
MRESRLIGGLRLYLVADPDHAHNGFADAVEAALRGGVTAVQLRWKTATDLQVFEQAKTVGALCRAHGALFFVNDRVDLALGAGADGVHLGVDDLPVDAARTLAGPNFLIGYSPATDSQTSNAASLGADYLGVGPVFGTSSKDDAGPSIGLETIRRRVAEADVPVIGIGGVTTANAAAVIETGAVGVAVLSAILGAADPEGAARALNSALSQ